MKNVVLFIDGIKTVLTLSYQEANGDTEWQTPGSKSSHSFGNSTPDLWPPGSTVRTNGHVYNIPKRDNQ